MGRRPYHCKSCGQAGHNSATCGRPKTAQARNPVISPIDILTEQIKDRLGKEPDTVIEEELNLEYGLVRRIRVRLGIPRYRKPAFTSEGGLIDQKYPGLRELLGIQTDAQLARIYKISRERVRQYRFMARIERPTTWSPEDVSSLMGDTTDKAIADMVGVTPATVTRHRHNMGISSAAATRVSQINEKIATMHDQVGKLSDRKIAKALGVTLARVVDYRNKHGIPPAKLSPRCAGFVPLDRDVVRQMFEAGAKDREIAEKIGSTAGVVAGIRKQLKLYRREPYSRVSEQDKNNIMWLHDEERISASEIARRMDMPRATVTTIIRKGANK